MFDRASFPQMYERHLVGPLFRPWAVELLDEAGLREGERTLDLVALQLEERDLLKEHGASYASYRERVPMLVPGAKARRSPEARKLDPA